jgi:SAM-dependent methyltransferase
VRNTTLARLQPFAERSKHFSGWEFSALGVGHLGPPQPWSYARLARSHAEASRRVLDIDTGGGEALARAVAGLPARVAATEAWLPNLPVAWERLTPLGVDLVCAAGTALPFAPASVDLVLNRHGALDPADAARVLRPGGWLITQQIGANHWQELRRYFPRMNPKSDTYRRWLRAFPEAGLEIVENAEHDERMAYPSLGEMVFMLCAVPWTVPNFDVERDLDALLGLEAEHLTDKGLIITESHCMVVAHKPV